MKSNVTFHNDWDQLLQNELKNTYFINLMTTIEKEYHSYKVYPKYEDLFNALKFTSYENVKVVIIGQDPYHQENQAHGLCFSVSKYQKIPKSLHNIFLELVNDVHIKYPEHGNLINWTQQGVLLLNTVLTVRDSLPGSHRNLGWEKFTNQIITLLDKKTSPIVFLLWGNDAKKKASLVTNKQHLILESVHPSPLSAHRGFIGCKHFSQTNQFLIKHAAKPINWQI